jgi:hypothetical protein
MAYISPIANQPLMPTNHTICSEFYSVVQDIDCSKNPYALNHPASKIIQKTLRVKQKQPDAKIVVLMGQWHDEPLHQILFAVTLQMARQAGLNPNVAMEYDYNYYGAFAQRLFGYNLNKDIQLQTQKEDTDNKHLLDGASAYAQYFVDCPLTTHYLFEFLKLGQYSTRFIDLPHKKDWRLDPNHQITKDLLKDLKINESIESIHATDSLGIKLRNIFMFGMAEQFMLDKISGNHDVLFVSTGNLHLDGWAYGGFDPEHGLESLFKDAGYTVISVLNTKPDCIFNKHATGATLRSFDLVSTNEPDITEHDIIQNAMANTHTKLPRLDFTNAIRKSRKDFKTFVDAAVRNVSIQRSPWKRFIPTLS